MKKVLLAATALMLTASIPLSAHAGNGPFGLVTGIGGSLEDGVNAGNMVGVQTQHELRGLGIFGDLIGAMVGTVAGVGMAVVTYPKNVINDAAN